MATKTKNQKIEIENLPDKYSKLREWLITTKFTPYVYAEEVYDEEMEITSFIVNIPLNAKIDLDIMTNIKDNYMCGEANHKGGGLDNLGDGTYTAKTFYEIMAAAIGVVAATYANKSKK